MHAHAYSSSLLVEVTTKIHNKERGFTSNNFSSLVVSATTNQIHLRWLISTSRHVDKFALFS